MATSVFLGLTSWLLFSSAHAAPSSATVTIQPDQIIAKTRDNRLLGGNIALWYEQQQLQELEKSPYWKQWKPGLIRIPGGSWSDEFFWNGNGVREGKKIDRSKLTKDGWQVDYSGYKPGFRVMADLSPSDYHGVVDVRTLHEFAKKNATDTMVTVNAGLGTPEMAAEWVRWANKKMGYNVKYWEIGNELEGSWELGNTRPDGSKMTAKKYAAIYTQFAKAMKAVDPSIKIGGPTSSNDSITFVEELIKSAGDNVDFVSFHTYPVDSRISNPQEILNQSERISIATQKIRRWIQQYQPDRVDKIEIGITEWHVKVHEDVNTGNLLSGLWCSRFIGEMFKNNIDFANEWDTFSTTDHGGGHGLFSDDDPRLTTPRAAYWALWMWSNTMGDQLVKSTTTGNPDVVSYATKDQDTVAVMLFNQSPTDTIPVTLNIPNDQSKTARTIEFSHKNYLWNPFTHQPVWSLPPAERTIDLEKKKEITLPPMSSTVVRLGEKATHIQKTSSKLVLDLILPKEQSSDTPFSSYVVLKADSKNTPYSGKPVEITLTADGPVKVSPTTISTNNPATPITITPTGAGLARITLKSGSTTVVKPIQFKKISLSNQVVWTFGDQGQIKEVTGSLPARMNTEVRRNENVYEVPFRNWKPTSKKNLILKVNPMEIPFPKDQVGGVIAQIKISPSLAKAPADAHLQIILQSQGNHWMIINKIKLRDLPQTWKSFEFPVNDPQLLKAMPALYSLVFIVDSSKPLNGSIYIDDLGFIRRN
jgi:alpha-L-arabinofuranosidase